ncbi:MAG: hypothetical protein JSS07_11015 [Proteobacteria bacterium]|nr:hypothetical protein [Pseudomonadota bacterium]
MRRRILGLMCVCGVALNSGLVHSITGNLSQERMQVPTQTLSHIFENMEEVRQDTQQVMPSWGLYKEKLRDYGSIHFSDSVQIGVDRIKTNPTKLIKGEIVDVNDHMAPKTAKSSARGFGIQMKVKL